MNSILTFKNVSKSFLSGTKKIKILEDINFSLKMGESVGLLAPSGTGKSTLLYLAGLLEKPSKGDIVINNIMVKTLKDSEKTLIRQKDIGFIYQFHYLMNDFTALENVMLPLLGAGYSYDKAQERAIILLKEFKLDKHLYSFPGTMSGGEQQRVAIARALINKPKIILADEPTGNLDEKTAYHVFTELIHLSKKNNISIFMVTHNEKLSKKLDRIFTLDKGKLYLLN